ncbi:MULTISPECIES: VWA domain-containing protein [Mesorhizobium]|uniref:vWA domain-containing protein n=11 Tax=Phyllobacteriaceae TaxID=69277 RepID=UPI000FCA951B|nr:MULTISPECIES: VWA domain-containing protein [Mesorhizobium]MCF6126784.1 von Willebrand factor type A domain-containing protein [Mesorhizobium ciceri]MCQ8816401.1 von Willebrand factor type A domain-containing protein [Mesorhizobium sp. SEMIA396]RUX68982.1 VWA domain-containing protein [Mesorhizobium sp. M7A.F.Ca.CA.004.08.2.1]RUX81184.1 VWA domain-containing protein [Mesorhizobium sp. M7A.F.Ca.CA.004.08.1.1]RUY02035.1 VWA domain-containing protein [Mesorhizobium sp. M7A.F.Ca.CA.004.04.1.1]
MVDDNELNRLRDIAAPAPAKDAKARAFEAALRAYDQENISAVTQGSIGGLRLTERAQKLWSEIMQKKLIATPALAGLVALPIAGYATFHLLREQPPKFGGDEKITETLADKPATVKPTTAEPKPARGELEKDKKADADVESRGATDALVAPASPQKSESTVAGGAAQQNALERGVLAEPAPPAPTGEFALDGAASVPSTSRARMPAESKLMAPQQPSILPADQMQPQPENRDRIEDFKTNPVHAALEDPVSTFSIDVDTASYSFVRGSLKQGTLPQADTVRVEEMINYFPYDWKGPESASTPFNSTVSVMPTPWNTQTRLMHVAIKGFDVKPTEQPKANLVFLIDVSGSMDEPDKLPLLKSAFRLLVSQLKADDTISIVTYAGDAGTVLEPTKASEKDKILSAIDNLTPGGSTAGEAGIKEAYRLAQKSFVKDGVNRVMLATDGDFNVGQTDDDDLKRLIESERKTGVFLSVFGFGRGNLNDQMMQTIAQNGNGTAAYIDTLAEAEKVLVEDASSTLFTIAKDVKIQVEFNPNKVSEYRLIGYETRALNREDFNNDRVDAGDIGSGHSVTAIYEITPKGSGGEQIDQLRYGQASVDNGGVANADEYAFVKIRYKLPNEDVSKLITTPVTSANEISSFDQASTDQRFSVAVAAFGQKLRDEDATAKFGYDKIMEIATAARGADPFGYRAEFLSLVRLASALGGNR